MNPSQLIENRSVQLIFRDCLKLAGRMMEDPVRVQAVRRLLRSQFEKNKNVLNPQEVRALKMNAVRGISNYIIYTVKQQYVKPRDDENILEQEEPGLEQEAKK